MSTEKHDHPRLDKLVSATPKQLVVEGATGMRRMLDILASGLGIGRNASRKPEVVPPDTGTQLALERTDKAMDRTYWAAERTLMAWIRTAISMISFGFTIGKIGQAVHDVDVKGLQGMRTVSVGTIAYLLVLLGTFALLAAALQYGIRVHALHKQGLRKEVSLAFPVALVLALLGIFAFSALAMRL